MGVKASTQQQSSRVRASSSSYSSSGSRVRASSCNSGQQNSAVNIPVSRRALRISTDSYLVTNGAAGRVDPSTADSSTDDDSSPESGPRPSHSSLPAQLFASSILTGIKCPVCSKFIPPDDIECHLVVCLTKPRIGYNEDVLTNEAGECVICLEELEEGHIIARLPCLCIYHKRCIDSWFEKSRSCPEHPPD